MTEIRDVWFHAQLASMIEKVGPGPVYVTGEVGSTRYVMMSAAEYERLKRRAQDIINPEISIGP